jgi:hypothetical protein
VKKGTKAEENEDVKTKCLLFFVVSVPHGLDLRGKMYIERTRKLSVSNINKLLLSLIFRLVHYRSFKDDASITEVAALDRISIGHIKMLTND